MVALSGFLEHGEVLLEHARLGERDTIYAAKLGVVGVASPVGAGAVGQLDRLDGGNAHQVRSGAEVGEVALLVEADLLALVGVLLGKLYLVGLAQLLQQRDRIVRLQLKTTDLQTGLDDLFHLRLDFLQILVGEGLFYIKIIIKARFDGGTDGAFGFGI